MPSLPSLFHMRRKSDAPPSTRPSVESPDEIVRKLNLMSIRSQSRPPTAQDDDFVGGFHPAVGGNAPYGSPGRPVPPPFPTPHPGPPPIPPRIPAMVVTPPAKEQGMSRTMEMALSPPDFGVPGPSRRGAGLQRPPLDASPRPRSDPVASTRIQAEGSRSVAVLPLLLDADDQPFLSVPPKLSASRRPSPTVQTSISHPPGRSLSSPATTTPSSSDLPDKVICSGFTKANVRCTRSKLRSMLSLDSSVWYCHQHEPEALRLDHFRAPGGDFVKYSVFIPEYLSPNAQANLRAEMEKAISTADGLGYIYIYQCLDKHFNPDMLLYKAGRTVNPKQRNDQWSKQCVSKEHHIVYVHPQSEDKNATSLMAANLNPGPPGICCHRLERFVLIELADLAHHTQYLHPLYRVEDSKLKWDNLDQAVRDRKPPLRTACKDCHIIHRELFGFARVKSGPLVGQELEKVIIPVINRWANFLCLHAMKDA